jgi:histidine ammonia-lyase
VKKHLIQPNQHLSIEQVQQIVQENYTIELSAEAIELIRKCRVYLDNRMAAGNEAIYGINTGFGALYNTAIPNDQLEILQHNLLVSHACGMGEEVPQPIVKLMLLLKVQGLSHGHSGVQVETVQRLCDFFNLNILPVVYQQGSLGASGDLAPLAHLTIPLFGEGEVYYNGQKMQASEALQKANLKPITLKSKEGLALINGTQFMSSYAVYNLLEAEKIQRNGMLIAAMSLEGFDGRPEPFDVLTHAVRPHDGQRAIAAEMQSLLLGSEIINQPKKHVQDPYSFRCIPQVHGASADAIAHVKRVVETEINSVTDNPIIFPDEDRVISGGNFHGQPLALSLDFLAIAIAELGSMAERRTYKLISGQRGLPPFLVTEAGLNSGFMIPQYAAAGIVSQNKQLCTPASVDTIDSSNGQEDHVSMGANAATKCARVVENVKSILAIEAINAAQALEFRRPLKSSASVEQLHAAIRAKVPMVEQDVYMHEQMMNARKVLFG